MRAVFIDTVMGEFKEWLKNEESCGTMGCPGHPFKSDDTPAGRAAKIYPKYKLNNKGCSGTTGPCATDPPGGGTAGASAPVTAASPAAKMKKK
jgi:hypothetical protein